MPNPDGSPEKVMETALPEPSALSSPVSDDEIALKIANDARNRWSSARQHEVRVATELEVPVIEEKMASEIFDAVLNYLNPLPRAIQVKVIAKFKAINLPSER